MNKELLLKFKNFYSDFMNEDVIEFTKDRDDYTDDEIYDLFVAKCGDESAPVDDVVNGWQEMLHHYRNNDLFDDKYETKNLAFIYAFQMGFSSRQPEVDALKEEINRLKMDCMTHEYNQAEAEKFRPEYERQLLEPLQEENAQLKKRVEELEGIANGIEEGADFWKSEYDACRAILSLLVQLKVEKDTLGKTDFYIQNQPLAWMEAKEFLKKYQHH